MQRPKRFRLDVYGNDSFVQAVELRDDNQPGLRFVMAVPPGTPPPWGHLRDRIRKRLSERFAVRDERGELHLLRDVVEGRLLGGPEDNDEGPSIFVDDSILSWAELGRTLRTFAGWNLRIEILDPTDSNQRRT